MRIESENEIVTKGMVMIKREGYGQMKIIITKDYDEMSRRAADIIFAQVLMKPDSVLGLATGSSPIGIYENLVKRYNKGRIDFSEVTTINLDEYQGLHHDNEQSYWYFMHDHFFNHVNIRPENIHVPDGANMDADQACQEYDALIEEAGGIDLQLLGLGPDGHIGFNEPSDHFPVHTHCVKLEESTIEANKRFFESKDDVPRKAYTLGIGGIMQARKVLMVVNGSKKAGIVKDAFLGPVTPEIPASILQLHRDFTLVLDEDAAEKIKDKN